MQQLAEACEEMEDMNSSILRRVMVHQDLKLDNVFLSEPLPAHFPNYPVLKFGDFGSSRHTSRINPQNPDFYTDDAKTDGYLPPEKWDDRDWANPRNRHPVGHGPWGPDPSPGQRNPNIWKVSGYTNMWQCGQIMANLLTQNAGARQDDHTDPAQRVLNLTRRLHQTKLYRHVHRLHYLISRMRAFQPWLRPGATQLRRHLDRGRVEAGRRRRGAQLTNAELRFAHDWDVRMDGQDVQVGRPRTARQREDTLLRGMKQDRYAVGLSIMGRTRNACIRFEDRGRAVW